MKSSVSNHLVWLTSRAMRFSDCAEDTHDYRG